MCPECGDSGNLTIRTIRKEGHLEIFHACYCAAGEKYRQPMFAASDKEKKYPRYLPVLPRPTAGINYSSLGRDMRLKD